MESLRRWFTFSKGERIAILTLLTAILVLIGFYWLHPPRQSLSNEALHDLDSLLALRQAALEQQRADSLARAVLNPSPFDPNTLTEEQWLQMGLSERQVSNIMNYMAHGGRFRTKNDLGKLYTITEEDMAQLRPFITLPDRQQGNARASQPQWEEYPPYEKKEIPVVDLNTVDSATLVELPQIGPFTAMRIIRYREELGGFVDMEQLREVKGMDSARFATAAPYINIGEGPPRRLDVNRADFKTLLHHPYLSYEQVKRIFNHRDQRGMIKGWTQLETLIKEEGEVNPWLEQYLKY